MGQGAIHPGEREVLMRRTTYYVFQSASVPDLHGITGDPDGARGSVAALKLALLELRPEDVERGWQ
jgi:hypothetical protein